MFTRTRRFAALILVAAVAVALAGDATAEEASPLPADFSGLAEPLLPAVVAISRERALPRPAPAERPGEGITPPEDDPSMIEEFFRRFFGRTRFSPLQQPDLPGQEPHGALPQPEGPMPQAPMPEGPMPEGGLVPFAAGSGFLASGDGLVVTNNHVVADASSITVRLHDGRDFDARLVGRDEMTEIALLRIDVSEDLTPLPWGESDAVRVGEWVLAIGNPFGIGNSVTAGIVSARPRAIGRPIPIDVLQTDAALNVGNSGGPLVNRQGEVVGVNVAILSPVGADIGIGFSNPSNIARDVVETIAREGEVRRGWLGVATQSLDERLADLFGLREAEGALVTDVIAGSPAEAAGILVADGDPGGGRRAGRGTGRTHACHRRERDRVHGLARDASRR
jgi:serine protease Do